MCMALKRTCFGGSEKSRLRGQINMLTVTGQSDGLLAVQLCLPLIANVISVSMSAHTLRSTTACMSDCSTGLTNSLKQLVKRSLIPVFTRKFWYFAISFPAVYPFRRWKLLIKIQSSLLSIKLHVLHVISVSA